MTRLRLKPIIIWSDNDYSHCGIPDDALGIIQLSASHRLPQAHDGVRGIPPNSDESGKAGAGPTEPPFERPAPSFYSRENR